MPSYIGHRSLRPWSAKAWQPIACNWEHQTLWATNAAEQRNAVSLLSSQLSEVLTRLENWWEAKESKPIIRLRNCSQSLRTLLREEDYRDCLIEVWIIAIKEWFKRFETTFSFLCTQPQRCWNAFWKLLYSGTSGKLEPRARKAYNIVLKSITGVGPSQIRAKFT